MAVSMKVKLSGWSGLRNRRLLPGSSRGQCVSTASLCPVSQSQSPSLRLSLSPSQPVSVPKP
eukprot:122991-Hanusia_phi.AAC.1